jgi:hypothetical protein
MTDFLDGCADQPAHDESQSCAVDIAPGTSAKLFCELGIRTARMTVTNALANSLGATGIHMDRESLLRLAESENIQLVRS